MRSEIYSFSMGHDGALKELNRYKYNKLETYHIYVMEQLVIIRNTQSRLNQTKCTLFRVHLQEVHTRHFVKNNQQYASIVVLVIQGRNRENTFL